ncbi:MAG: glycosyltransferase family 1 protein [Pseudomonadota bacterium]
MKRFLLITDAWDPQTNGVVTTWHSVLSYLPAAGYEVNVIHAGLFKTWPLPSYPEIRISINPWLMKKLVTDYRPDHVHVATEGPLGVYARGMLKKRRIAFTTSLHTKFPEYVYERVRLPLAIGYRFMRWFHRPAVRTLCTTQSHKEELQKWGLGDLTVWSRGVDISKFQPQALTARARPRLLYVGRVAVEKNVEAFLELDIDADKVIVGDGPQRADLEQKYPAAQWLGYRKGQALVDEYAQADAFVFPSLTDTFGLVMLEANGCGTPVAAFPVTGPIDVVREGVNGSLHEDLGVAIDQALMVSRAACRAHAQDNTWEVIARRLLDNLAAVDWNRAV